MSEKDNRRDKKIADIALAFGAGFGAIIFAGSFAPMTSCSFVAKYSDWIGLFFLIVGLATIGSCWWRWRKV